MSKEELKELPRLFKKYFGWRATGLPAEEVFYKWNKQAFAWIENCLKYYDERYNEDGSEKEDY